MLELQGHGGPAVLQLVLQRCLELGARLAQPGEFTQRAFLNDKMDLAQAESVADLIDATTEQAARSAMRSLQGEFSAAIHSVVDAADPTCACWSRRRWIFRKKRWTLPIRELRASTACCDCCGEVEHIDGLAKQGSILREGAQVVLVGAAQCRQIQPAQPSGGEEVALVSEIPGTTRDVIRQAIQIEACRCTSSIPPGCAKRRTWWSKWALPARNWR